MSGWNFKFDLSLDIRHCPTNQLPRRGQEIHFDNMKQDVQYTLIRTSHDHNKKSPEVACFSNSSVYLPLGIQPTYPTCPPNHQLSQELEHSRRFQFYAHPLHGNANRNRGPYPYRGLLFGENRRGDITEEAAFTVGAASGSLSLSPLSLAFLSISRERLKGWAPGGGNIAVRMLLMS